LLLPNIGEATGLASVLLLEVGMVGEEREGELDTTGVLIRFFREVDILEDFGEGAGSSERAATTEGSRPWSCCISLIGMRVLSFSKTSGINGISTETRAFLLKWSMETEEI
jgi:hypothetical protein